MSRLDFIKHVVESLSEDYLNGKNPQNERRRVRKILSKKYKVARSIQIGKMDFVRGREQNTLPA